MFLLRLLTLPVSGPVGFTVWVAEQLRVAAEEELASQEAAARQELGAVEQEYARGNLSERERDERSTALLGRMIALRKARGETGL